MVLLPLFISIDLLVNSVVFMTIHLQDGNLCIFNLLAGVGKKGGPGDKEERLVMIDVRQGGGEVMGVSHHPHRNLIATYGKDGLLKLWKP